MDVSATSRAIESVNQVLQNATSKTLDYVEKAVKVNAEMKLGVESGKGINFDAIA